MGLYLARMLSASKMNSLYAVEGYASRLLSRLDLMIAKYQDYRNFFAPRKICCRRLPSPGLQNVPF